MARKRRQRAVSKYADEAMIAKGKISKIEYKNMLINEKYKTVFYVPSQLCPEGRMCISWGYTNIDIGDEIEMKGRFSDGAFLVWSLKIHKRGEEIANEQDISRT